MADLLALEPLTDFQPADPAMHSFDAARTLADFLAASDFMRCGGVMTDLDGTAIHEEAGRVFVSLPMEAGLKRMNDLSRTVVLNTMRFPLSVIRSFGAEWYRIAERPIPLVSLRGSQCGRLVMGRRGELQFEELATTCLTEADIQGVLHGVAELLDLGLDRLLLFFYPRDWTQGEIIWTPSRGRSETVNVKFARVIGGDIRLLERELRRQPICLVVRLIDEPPDQTMAYQHIERVSILTTAGVDKRHGAEQIAVKLGIDLTHSIGAGDTEMDDFLAAVGLAVIVGPADLPFRGLRGTVRLPDSKALGALLESIAGLAQRQGNASAS